MKRLPKKPAGQTPLAQCLRELIEYIAETRINPAPGTRRTITTTGTFVTAESGKGGGVSGPPRYV